MVAEHITNLPSSKHSGARARTQMLAVHSAETPLAAGYAASVTSNWLNKLFQADGSLIEASINTFFGPDTTVRAVHTDCAAWHASWANSLSVGYEFTGYAALSRDQWLTQAGQDMLDRAGREIAADAAHYGIPIRWLSTAEVNQIAAGNTSIRGLATHRQIDPVNRTDPGDGFPYDILLASIRKYAGQTSQSKEEETYTMSFTQGEKNELLANMRKVVGETVGLKSDVADIKAKTDRYLDTKISEVANKVVEKEFPKLGLGVDAKGKPIVATTTIKAELGWLPANVKSIRDKVDEVKK